MSNSLLINTKHRRQISTNHRCVCHLYVVMLLQGVVSLFAGMDLVRMTWANIRNLVRQLWSLNNHFSSVVCSAVCPISPQLVFMVWNAVNDPLFGYLQDTSKMRCCSQRRLSILYGAPLYSLTFLLPWFPWRSYYPGDWLSGLHLMVALCAFDGLLTFVLLAQCALFAEISSNHQNRLRLVQYSQVPVQILEMPRGSVSGSLIPSLFYPRWPLLSAPPASSSVALCLETWRTLHLFRPSRCWWRC